MPRKSDTRQWGYSKIRWIAAYYPNDNPSAVVQIEMCNTKRTAEECIRVWKKSNDTRGFTAAIFKAEIVETEQ